MTRKEQDMIEKHFDKLHDIASGLNPNISDEFKVAMKAAYVAGADYAIDMFACNWISVDDELPKINPNDSEWEYSDDVIVALKDGSIAVGRYERDNSIGEHYWVLYGLDVTHWQHLPAPPKKGGEQ